MFLTLIAVTSAMASEYSAADAMRRHDLGLPPLSEPPAIFPFTWKDKLTNAGLWALALLPVIGAMIFVGTSLYVTLKIVFAAQGQLFP